MRKRTDDQIAVAIASFKESLLASGYRIANGPGELVSTDGTTWIGTNCTHGECRVYMWRRPRGYGRPEGRCYFVFGTSTRQSKLVALHDWLVRYADKPPEDERFAWPAPDSLPAYP